MSNRIERAEERFVVGVALVPYLDQSQCSIGQSLCFVVCHGHDTDAHVAANAEGDEEAERTEKGRLVAHGHRPNRMTETKARETIDLTGEEFSPGHCLTSARRTTAFIFDQLGIVRRSIAGPCPLEISFLPRKQTKKECFSSLPGEKRNGNCHPARDSLIYSICHKRR